METMQNILDTVEGYVYAAHRWQSSPGESRTELMEMIGKYVEQKLQQPDVRCCRNYLFHKLAELDTALLHGSDKIAHDKAMDLHFKVSDTLKLIKELEVL